MAGVEAPRRVRALGGFETYFEAFYQTLGAYNLSALFALSRGISLAQLQTCADKLRAHHRMLQVTPCLNWTTRTAYFQLTPHLRTHVVQYEGPLSVTQHMSLLTDGAFAPEESDEERRCKRMAHRQSYLPWSLYLSPRGDHVTFVTTHSICDGMGLDIVGADIIRCLNDEQLGDVVEISPPLEAICGDVSVYDRVRAVYSDIANMATEMWSNDLPFAGLQTTSWSRDYKTRQPVVCTIEVSLQDIEQFHRACGAEQVSLTSGIISSFYEVLGSRKELNLCAEKLEMSVVLDARRRLSTSHDISNEIGVYFGNCPIVHDGRQGNWAQRAREIHASVHGVSAVVAFKDTSLQCGSVFLLGKSRLDAQTYGKRFGRIFPSVTSNLGRAQQIDRANQLATCNDGVQIDRMSFDISHQACGVLFLMHICTVGNSMTVMIKSYEPFVQQNFVDAVGDHLRFNLVECSR